jgi:NADH:ubiquinone oxidoreductase subunit E
MSVVTPELKAKFETVVSRYPSDQKQSAVIPLLHLFQEAHGGSLTQEHQQAVADFLSGANSTFPSAARCPAPSAAARTSSKRCNPSWA